MDMCFILSLFLLTHSLVPYLLLFISFDVTDATACFKTIAGRTLNEIFREHMFQLSLTFHGGMEVVAYEWGAPTYYGPLSPDDTAQAVIAGAYSQYGGKFSTSKQYDYGTMNDKVYYVRG